MWGAFPSLGNSLRNSCCLENKKVIYGVVYLKQQTTRVNERTTRCQHPLYKVLKEKLVALINYSFACFAKKCTTFFLNGKSNRWKVQEEEFSRMKWCNAQACNNAKASAILPLDNRLDHSMVDQPSGLSNRLLPVRSFHASLAWSKRSLRRSCLIASTNSCPHLPQPHNVYFVLWIFENIASLYLVLVHLVPTTRGVYKHDPPQYEVNAHDMLSTSTFLWKF